MNGIKRRSAVELVLLCRVSFVQLEKHSQIYDTELEEEPASASVVPDRATLFHCITLSQLVDSIELFLCLLAGECCSRLIDG